MKNPEKEKILVTGGAGYIGSHCCVELLLAGYKPICVDNLSNSSIESMRRVEAITGMTVEVHDVDLCDEIALSALEGIEFHSAIHFAGLKSVNESVDAPLTYYDNNIKSLLNLCAFMEEYGCRNLVFSSSASVYNKVAPVPLEETAPTLPATPYGRTKFMIEQILRDLHASDGRWNISILRYFNPAGAHSLGLIGESPNDIPSNLMPYITQVAAGVRDQLQIFGDDYDTEDGTCIRDFIHVVDLAKGHLAALRFLEKRGGYNIHNLGTGKGHSVMEVVKAFERVNGVSVPYVVAPRRVGDVPINYAAIEKAKDELDWEAALGLEDIVRDAWNWQKRNPNGY